MKIQIGDVLQVDGGLVIIKEVETVRAFCLPLPGFKNLKADIFKHGFGVEQASRNVLERRGEAGLAAFLAEQKQGKQAERNSMVRLEPGDALCYHGHRCTVVAVVEDGALLQNAAGEEFEEAREVNEFLFADCSCKGHVAGRLDAAGRAENLRRHNEAMAAVTAEAKTETKKEPKMKANKTKTKTETKTKEAKAAKPAAEKPKLDSVSQPEIMGFRVRSVIRLLGKKGADSEEIANILAAFKITVPAGAIPNEIKHGKTGKGALAELSKDQVSELMALSKK